MSYRLWIKSLPTTLRYLLRQPPYIAGIISVGVHGLMWFVLPVLPLQSSEAEEPEIQRRVSLVELTPTEQGRLPDFSTSQVTIPQVPPQLSQQPDFYSLTPLPNSYTPIPTPPYPNYQGSPRVQVNPYQDFNRRSSGSTSRQTRNSGNASTNRNAPDENTSGQSDANNTDANSGNPRNSNNTDPNNSNSNSTNPNNTDPNNSNSNNTDPNNTNSNNTNPDQTAQNNTNPPAPPDYVARLQQEQEQLRQLYSYNPEGTGEGDRTSEFRKWLLEELSVPSNNPDIPGLLIEVGYPRQACLFQLEPLPKEAAFGVVLNGEGELVGEPRKLQSSGYGAFDQQAVEAIKASDFSQTSDEDYVLNGNRVYYVRVKFVPPQNGCPAPAAPQGAG